MQIIARVEAAMNRCADERKEAALKQARHSQADLPGEEWHGKAVDMFPRI